MSQKKLRAGYAINEPGKKPYDEARRAAADVCRLARIWVSIAENNEHAMNPTVAIHVDEDSGEETWVERSDIPDRETPNEDHVREEVRAHWELWNDGVQRLKLALPGVEDADAALAKGEARHALMKLIRIFAPPLFLYEDEKPGDHLLRGGGPLSCKAGQTAKLTRAEINKINVPLEDFSDLMITYDTRPKSALTPMSGDDSRWTVTRLCKHIDRGETTLTKWRNSAHPRVEKRRRLQSFQYWELDLIADAAEAGDDLPTATLIRQITHNRTNPS